MGNVLAAMCGQLKQTIMPLAAPFKKKKSHAAVSSGSSEQAARARFGMWGWHALTRGLERTSPRRRYIYEFCYILYSIYI